MTNPHIHDPNAERHPDEPASYEEVRDAVIAAIEGFTRITGVNVDGAVGNWTGSRTIHFGTWDVEKQVRDLQDLAVLDPSLLTCWMLVKAFYREWLEGKSLSVWQLVADPGTAKATLQTPLDVWALMQRPRVDRAVAAFQATLLRELAGIFAQRAAPGESPEDWIAQPHMLALLRRDALLAVDGGDKGATDRKYNNKPGLELHQFAQGKRAEGCAPVLAPSVYEFWNINSLLRALRSPQFPDQAIVVCLIRDPVEPLHSFFVLAVRNGDTISILTDREKAHQEHPLRKKMGRRPDKEMDMRASRWWFPYDLIDIAVSEDGKEAYAKARTALVPINAMGAPLKKLADLHPATLVWLALMLDLIRERFFREDRRALTVSYTGEMVRAPHVLAGEHSALVQSGAYQPLNLPTLDVARDLSPEAMAENTRQPSTGWNRWMVERYGDKVPEEILDSVGADEKKLLTDKAASILPMPAGENRIIGGHNFGPDRDIPNLPDHTTDRGSGGIRLVTLDPTAFGSADKLRKDRLWLAQVNRMRAIQRFAVDEYARTQDEVMRWYQKAVRSNRELLLDACARGSLMLPAGRLCSEKEQNERAGTTWLSGFTHGISRCVIEEQEALLWGVGPSWYSGVSRWEKSGHATSESWSRSPPTPKKGLLFREVGAEEERAWELGGVFCRVRPETPHAVARLCGVEVKDLPWQLQKFIHDSLEPYKGNDILNRLDAEDFALDNPWKGLPLNVGAVLTRTEANARRRRLGLPRLDWDAIQRWKGERPAGSCVWVRK